MCATCGDYRLQNTICEVLFRLSPTVEVAKKGYINSLFAKLPPQVQESLQTSFMSISGKSFEIGCRVFLNLLNSKIPTRFSFSSFFFYFLFLFLTSARELVQLTLFPTATIF